MTKEVEKMKIKRGKDYFRGKTVIVSGAASGIGAEIAKQLAAEGARVALTDVDQAGLETQREAIKSAVSSSDIDIFNIDIASRDSVSAGIEKIAGRFGAVNGLINTAAIFLSKPFLEIPLEQAEKILDINMRGTMVMCRAALPELVKNPEGFILNTSSISFCYGAPFKFLYDCTKSGILTMSQGLKLEFEDRGITLHVCLPYIVDTPMVADLSALPPVAQKAVKMMGKNTPGMVAHEMLKAIRQNRFLILPGREAKYYWRTYRVSPGFLGWVTKKMSLAE